MAGRLTSRLALLRHSRFRLLFVATFASGIGNWLAVVALQVDVYDRTHSGWWVGALLVANVLPAVFLGLLLGPVVDRFSRKGLMIGSDLGRLAVFAALPFTSSPRRRSRSLRRRHRQRVLPSGRARWAAEPRRRRGPAGCERAAPARRVDDHRGRTDRRRRARRRGRAAPRLLGERGELRVLGSLVVGDPGGAPPVRPAARAAGTGSTSARAIAPSGTHAR